MLTGTVTIGVLAMFIQYSQRFWRPIQGPQRQIQHPAGGHGRLRAHLQTARHPSRRSSLRRIPNGDGSNRIEFRHVWFTYQKLTEAQQAAVTHAAANGIPSTALSAIGNVEWILKDVLHRRTPARQWPS